MNVPQHVAIILDGNGRWAKSKGMPRNYGHAQGSKNVERIWDEMIRAVKRLAQDCVDGKIRVEEISDPVYESYLDTHGIPDPDLLIRTSGEQRLSNYLLWQMAYTEFYFTDVLWPDFTKEELVKAVEQYNRRDRRYGGVKEEQDV